MPNTITTLPADLPQNWTRGQVVAPDGAAVGLTEQHGFNYLCRQVNDAQRVINEQAELIRELRAELANVANEWNSFEQLGLTMDTATIENIHDRLPLYHTLAVKVWKDPPSDPFPYGYGIFKAEKLDALTTYFRFLSNHNKGEWRGTYLEDQLYLWSGWEKIAVE